MLKLEEKLKNKSAVIGIIGLGYVGLPTAVTFAEAGFRVIGFDVLPEKVDQVNRGKSYIADISPTRLQSAVSTNLQATSDQSRLKETDAVLICVPTPLTRTRDPDLSFVVKEAKEIARHLHPGQLIVLESTSYPGTTREVIMPILESTGLKQGQDYFLAFSPERIDPANSNYCFKNIPKIVGGVDANSTRLIEILYGQVVDRVIPVSSAETAEMAKVFENVFRNVNIALVNELAQLCERMGISVWEVIASASTKPFGFMPFYPGPGIGGHCIPLDPYYLSNKAREYDFHTRFIDLSTEINEGMPYYVVSSLMRALNEKGRSLHGARILVLGAAYKKNVADTRESPSLKLIELLHSAGAIVDYNDPYIPELKCPRGILKSVELTPENLAAFDCIVLATVHDDYKVSELVASAKLVFDTRGVTCRLKNSNIVRLGERTNGH